MRKPFRIVLITVCLVAVAVAAVFAFTSNPILGKWADAESFSEGDSTNPPAVMVFSRWGRLTLSKVHKGKSVTITAKYRLLAGNIVEIELPDLPPPINSKRYQYDQSQDELVEVGAWITPIKYKRVSR